MVDLVIHGNIVTPREVLQADFISTKNGIITNISEREEKAKRGLDIERFSKLISTHPAKRFNLYPRKGVLQVGSDADITVLDPRASFTVRSQDTYSVAEHTPYDGWTLNGRITHTFVQGQLVYDGRKVLENKGNFIKPIGTREDKS